MESYKLALLVIVAAMWMSNQRSKMEGIIETEWRDHYTYQKEPGSKMTYQAPDANKTKSNDVGINVYEEEETLEDYMEDEVTSQRLELHQNTTQ